MTFKNLYIEHERSSEAEDWVKEEIAEQEARFAEIEASMEALAEQAMEGLEEEMALATLAASAPSSPACSALLGFF